MIHLPITFQPKDFIGLALILIGTGSSTALLLLWPRARELAFGLMLFGAIFTEKLSINIYSAYWYRGTTRGFEVTFIDILAVALLLSSLLLPRPGQPRWYWPAGLGPMSCFLLYCTVSVFFASPMILGLFELSKLVRGIIFFLAAALYVRRERDLAVLAVALALAVGLEGALSLRQRYLEGVYRVTGNLDHPNSLSMYLCLATPVVLAAATSTLPAGVRRLCWAAVLAGTVTVLLTLSRAGIPAFALSVGGALAFCVSWRLSFRRLAVGGLVLLGVAGLVAKSWPLLVARFGQSTLEQEYIDPDDGESRGYYFRQAGVILEDQPFGVGLNNWSYWVSKKYGAPLNMHYEDYADITFAPPNDLLPMYRYAAPAHNLGVLTAGELGWTGLAVFAVVWLRWFRLGAGFLRPRCADPLRRLGVGLGFGLGGVFLQSMTEWTYRQTQIFLTFHLIAGVLACLHSLKQAPDAPADASAADAWPGTEEEPVLVEPLAG